MLTVDYCKVQIVKWLIIHLKDYAVNVFVSWLREG